MKAELFSSDFIIGLSIFLIAMTVFGIYYESLQNDIADYSMRNEIQSKAINIADLLVTNSGDPTGWNSTNVNVIGLYDSGLINLTKFEELKKINNSDYYNLKRLLGAGGYEIYVELKNETDQIIKNNSITYDSGKPNTDSASQVFYVERYGLTSLNGNITKIKIGVVVWL